MKFTIGLVALPLLAVAQETLLTQATPSLTEIAVVSSGVTTEIPVPTTATGTALCEPHGDHWHCPEGIADPNTPPPAGISAVTTHDDDDDHNHTDAEGSGALPPSPTASVGCEPHGDHWHCEGPRTGVDAVTTPSPSGNAGAQTSSGPVQQSTGAAVAWGVNAGGVLAAVGGAVMML